MSQAEAAGGGGGGKISVSNNTVTVADLKVVAIGTNCHHLFSTHSTIGIQCIVMVT